MVRTIDLNETGIASVIAHQHQRARRRRIARDQLGNAGASINVPDGRGHRVGRARLLDAHRCPLASVWPPLRWGMVPLAFSVLIVGRAPYPVLTEVATISSGSSTIWGATTGLGSE